MDPRVGLDDVEKRKFLLLTGLELWPFGRPARSQSLRCPGSFRNYVGDAKRTSANFRHISEFKKFWSSNTAQACEVVCPCLCVVRAHNSLLVSGRPQRIKLLVTTRRRVLVRHITSYGRKQKKHKKDTKQRRRIKQFKVQTTLTNRYRTVLLEKLIVVQRFKFFFNWYSGGWSPIGSTRHCGHLMAYCASPGWLWWWKNLWNDWQGKPKYPEKPAPMPLCPPQTPHAARTRTRVAAVGSQRLTAWATALPSSGLKLLIYI
jgi:hypothetical protein